MHLRIYFSLLIIFILAGISNSSCQSGAISAPAPLNRDWSAHPAIVEYDTEEDIFVIGDIHGDYKGLLNLLVASEIIAENPNAPNQVEWKAGTSFLVIPGDFVSKGKHSVDVLELLRNLQESASENGGRVILTFGNHEATILSNPDDHKVENLKKELNKLGISTADLIAGKDSLGIGKYLQQLPFSARVNDWYFVHAGNPEKRNMKELKELIEAEVEKEGFGAAILLDEKDGILEVRMDPRPWWEKKKDSPKESKKRLKELVGALGVNHIVVGHQPGKYTFSDGKTRKKGKIDEKFNGTIFFIDTGMESNNGEGAMLRIHKKDGKETVSVIFPDKDKTKILWQKD